jgi:hypothetical protein
MDDEKRKREEEEQKRRIRDLSIGKRRLGVIARLVILIVAVPMFILGALGVPHMGHAWVPLLALGVVETQSASS